MQQRTNKIQKEETKNLIDDVVVSEKQKTHILAGIECRSCCYNFSKKKTHTLSLCFKEEEGTTSLF